MPCNLQLGEACLLVCDHAATARNVSRTASGVNAALANEFFALSAQGSTRFPRGCAAMKIGDRDLKRGIRVSA